MKKSHFSETQIISILKQQEAGMKTTDICRDQSGNILQLEIQVWWHGSLRCEAVA